MPESWRSDMADLKNRKLIIMVVLFSFLFHLGLAVLFWKTEALKPSLIKDEPIFVDVVNGLPKRDSTSGDIVDKTLPSNANRPNIAKVIAQRDNRVEKETHRRDIPINNDTRDIGSKSTGGKSVIGSGRGTGNENNGKPKINSTNDLISSVGYKSVAGKGGKSARTGGRGNVSPYNPKIGSPGNAININTKSFKYVSYFASIKEKIEWAWVYPQSAQRNGQQGVLTITFTILRDGS